MNYNISLLLLITVVLMSCVRNDEANGVISQLGHSTEGYTCISYRRCNGEEEVTIDLSNCIRVTTEMNGIVTELGYRPMLNEDLLDIRRRIVEQHLGGCINKRDNIKISSNIGILVFEIGGGVLWPISGYEIDITYKSLDIDRKLLVLLREQLRHPEFSGILPDLSE